MRGRADGVRRGLPSAGWPRASVLLPGHRRERRGDVPSVTAPRKKRVWTVADFARHAYGGDDSGPACRRARRWLKRLDAKHGGQLLIPTTGVNREFTFYPAVLARLEADL